MKGTRQVMFGLSALLAPAKAIGTQRPTPATAFVDVTVVPMDREQVLPHQTVVVMGSQIAALGPIAEVPVPVGAQQIDGRGHYLLPGLGDMHRHEVKSEPRGLLQLLAEGITTVREMASDDVTLDAKQAVARGELLGPRIYTAGRITFNWNQEDSRRRRLMPRKTLDSVALAGIADSVAALKRAGHDFLKLYAWPRPIYDSAMAAARRVGLPVTGHVPALYGRGDPLNVELEEVLRDRWASMEHLFGYLEYLTGGFPEVAFMGFMLGGPWLDAIVDTASWAQPGYQWDSVQVRQIAKMTQQAGGWNCPTLRRLTFWESKEAWIASWRRMVLQLTKALQEVGAGLLLGSDEGGMLVKHGGVAEELQVMVEKARLTPYQALATGTRNVAVFLGTLDSTGTVTVGKRADLVLVNENPLADIRVVADPAGVMVGGQWLSRAELEQRLQALPQRGLKSRES